MLWAGCANRRDFVTQQRNNLAASKVTFQRVTDFIMEKYRAGMVSEAAMIKLIAVTKRWGSAHNTAESALELYLRTGTDQALVDYRMLLQSVDVAYRDMMELLVEFKIVDSIGVLR